MPRRRSGLPLRLAPLAVCAVLLPACGGDASAPATAAAGTCGAYLDLPGGRRPAAAVDASTRTPDAKGWLTPVPAALADKACAERRDEPLADVLRAAADAARTSLPVGWVFEVPSPTNRRLQATATLVARRIGLAGMSGTGVRVRGERLEVEFDDADEAQLTTLTGQGLVSFYDWETSVLGPDLEPAPDDAEVTGGPAAGTAGCLPQFEAVRRAARRPAVTTTDAANGEQHYVVDDQRHIVAGPSPAPSPVVGRPVIVREGTTVVRAEAPDGRAKPDCFYVLADDVALRGTEIEDPRQQRDDGPGGTGAPIVTYTFSPRSRATWHQLTRAIAERGQSRFLPGTDPISAAQHYAVVLDGQILTTPYIDFQRNPDGIDARTGSEIAGGFTAGSARSLVALLQTGPLPAPIELVEER